MSVKINILIIGGSSFVAKNFIRLHKDDYNIKIVSRTKTTFENEVLFADFSTISSKLFEGIDVVINCAAIVHKKKIVADEIYFKINYQLAVQLANKAKNQGVKSFFQLSTIAVYGKQNHITLTSIENPVTPYGKSKLKADRALLKLSENQFNVVIFRPPMIYGNKDAPGNMIRLIKFMAKGLPLPFKKMTNKRDFIHIDNLIGFINASIEKSLSGIYLVSDDSPVSINKLYCVIVQSLGKSNKSFSMPSFGYKVLKIIVPNMYDKLFSNLTIDISETLDAIDFKPKKMLEEGITEMTKGVKNKK